MGALKGFVLGWVAAHWLAALVIWLDTFSAPLALAPLEVYLVCTGGTALVLVLARGWKNL